MQNGYVESSFKAKYQVFNQSIKARKKQDIVIDKVVAIKNYLFGGRNCK